MDRTQRIAYFQRFGWAPVPHKHLPDPIRKIIDGKRYRMKMKCCYENAQKLVLDAPSFGVELTYVEGWYQSLTWVEHAWVELSGTLVDPTLLERKAEHYRPVTRANRDAVWLSVTNQKIFGPIDNKTLREHHPESALIHQMLQELSSG